MPTNDETIAVDDRVEVYPRSTLWRWPLYLTDLSLQRLEDIENNHDADQYRDIPETAKRQHQAFGAGAIVSSIALLETVSNTIIFDIFQGTPAKERYEFDVDQTKERTLNEYESIYEEKDKSLLYEPTLTKYNELLRFTGSEEFNTETDNLFKNVILAIKLRDQLVHAKPEYTAKGDRPVYGDYESLQGALKGKASKNPYSNTAVFEYFSFSYAQWTAQSVIQFIDEFHERISSDLFFEKSLEETGLSDYR